uniref:Uncharacterized protein n=1 Tax=Anguilla anguilla TaxID=7936 RepID=A0A0E9SP41_ANGAN
MKCVIRQAVPTLTSFPWTTVLWRWTSTKGAWCWAATSGPRPSTSGRWGSWRPDRAPR